MAENLNSLLNVHNLHLRNAFAPGDIGYITWMHGVIYAQEQGWDHTFEAYVAKPLSEFAMKPSPRQKIWIIKRQHTIVATVAIAEASQKEAQLRWLLIDPTLRGIGLGNLLVQEAIEFSRLQSYRSVFLWTVSSLSAAAKTYRAHGFKKVSEENHTLWGKELTEERYDLIF